MSDNEVDRLKFYGRCSVHGVVRDIRRTLTAEGEVTLEMFCAACDSGEPWPLDVLLSFG